jgi:hypothetical protein
MKAVDYIFCLNGRLPSPKTRSFFAEVIRGQNCEGRLISRFLNAEAECFCFNPVFHPGLSILISELHTADVD